MRKKISLTSIIAESFEIFRYSQGVVALKITETRISASCYDTNTKFLRLNLWKSFLNRCCENYFQTCQLRQIRKEKLEIREIDGS